METPTGLGKTREEPPGAKKVDIKEFMEDANQHLWSVSYADLLMVILAFFVVFDIKPKPNDNPGENDTVLARIISLIPVIDANKTPTAGLGELPPPVGSATAAGASRADGAPTFLPGISANPHPMDAAAMGAEMTTRLAAVSVPYEIEKAGTSLVIHFGDGIYKPGKYEVTGAAFKAALRVVAEAVRPYQNDTNIVFIGHADSRPLSPALRARVGSNMILSSLRAASAAAYVLGLGARADTIMTQGADAYGRGSRTLSIKITPKNGGLHE